MELVVQVMLVLALIGSFFQMSQWKLFPKIVLAGSLGLLCYLIYPWVLDQSRQELNQWLADSNLMQQLATIQMVEALAFILLDVAFLQSLFGHKIQNGIRYATYFPGLMLIVAILFLQMNSFYYLSHLVSFDLLGILFSGFIIFVFLSFPRLIQWLLPEAYLRLEMRYILCFGQILCSVVITFFCQKLPYSPTTTYLESKPLICLFLLVVGMFLIGWLGAIIKRKIKII